MCTNLTKVTEMTLNKYGQSTHTTLLLVQQSKIDRSLMKRGQIAALQTVNYK